MHIKYLAVAFAAVLGAGYAGSLGAAEPQVPAAVEADDPAKFFLFHLKDVSTDIARADLSYCIEQAKGILSMRDRMGGGGGGLLGALLNARMAEIDRLRMRNASMRKCMGLHGYVRYKMPQADWKKLLNDGDIVLSNKGTVDPDVVDRMAAFASGPIPTGERLDP
jgi:hypothetical protein